ncbi:MAG: hypothetical protein WDZ89_03300 [Gemmatimonadota bacterium]|jgi:hypothetical protein
MIATLLTLFAVGLLSIVALGIIFSIVGAVFSLTLGVASVLLFKVAPLVLIGWVVLKLINRNRPAGQLSAADRQWLESD